MVIAHPYCSPDPAGPVYEQYCCQSLMLHKTFRHVGELLAGHATYAEAYADFLQTGNIPPSLEEAIFCHQQPQTTQEITQNEINFLYTIHIYHVHMNSVAFKILAHEQ